MTASLPTTINDVLAELDSIIDRCIEDNDARGIFAYVYRRTTEEIKVAIEASEFGDNDILHRFDVCFAGYYLEAYRQFEQGEECRLVWSESFNGCKERLTVVQHILLGMNAHINFDLALTAAVQAEGSDIQKLKADFMTVNVILERIVNDLQQRLSRVSPLFFVLDWLGRNNDEKLINFSMKRARDQAWRLAVDIHSMNDENSNARIIAADQAFALFAKKIRKPNSKFLRWVLGFISRFEEKDVGRVIEKMRK